jgi:cytochrome c oxidase cbb3-type subunit 2
MPAYPWLARTELDLTTVADRLRVQRQLGVPYTEDMIQHAAADVQAQVDPDNANVPALMERYGEKTQVSAFDGVTTRLTEADAVIAYLQVLGQMTDAPYQEAVVAGSEVSGTTEASDAANP